MLKDEDFDEIGKRLHDLEADPPEDGWNRISGTVIPPPPVGPGKSGFVTRNWWKPLVLLIPVVLYLTVPRNGDKTLSMSSGADTLQQNNAIAKPSNESNTRNTNNSENLNSADQNKNTLQDNTQIDNTQVAQTKTESQREEIKGSANQSATANVNSKQESGRIVNKAPTAIVTTDSNALNENAAVDQRKNKTEYASSVQLSESKRNVVPVVDSVEEKVSYRKDDTAAGKEEKLVMVQSGNNLGVTTTVTEENTDRIKKQNKPNPQNETTLSVLAQGTVPTEKVNNTPANTETTPSTPIHGKQTVYPDTLTSKSTTPGRNEALVAIPGNENEDYEAAKERNKIKYVAAPGMADANSGNELQPREIIADSIQEEKSLVKAADSIRIPALEKERETGLWRITATFSPHYMFKTIRPDEDDEVLVTNINKNSRYPERIGYGFAVGAGKEIKKNVYIDGQLNYFSLGQNLSYSYANGNIDTLIQVRKADGNVYAIPVYQTIDSEINSRFTYGGLRIGATYYLWENQRRRFNVSVFGGMNYRVSGSIRERINNTWYDRPLQNINRTNYSLMFSGGYNVGFKGGWELMLNPMITYYSESGSTSLQRLSLRQKSYGVNVMISKTIGRK